MNATSRFGKRNLLGFLAAVLLGIFAWGQIPVRAATDMARVVRYGQNDKRKSDVAEPDCKFKGDGEAVRNGCIKP